MPLTDELAPALRALDDCEAALARLDAGCCDPGRSPSMVRLGATIGEARWRLEALAGPSADPAAAIERLEEAGAQIGRLQVTCCASNRMPLYALILERLTDAQLAINGALGTGH